MNKKNIEELKLSEEQLQKLEEFRHKERILRRELQKCKVSKNGIEHIIDKSDMNKVDENHLEELDEEIRNEWKDFIFE